MGRRVMERYTKLKTMPCANGLLCEVDYDNRDGGIVILDKYGLALGYVDNNELIEAVGKSDKYRLHDLRKNPEDLPKENENILFYTIHFDDENEKRCWTGFYMGFSHGCNFANDDYEGYVTKGIYKKSEVIAWREIEPLEEEDNERKVD